PLRADARRLRRRGARSARHRSRAAAGTRVRQAVADQRLGGPGGLRAGHDEPDDVQVTLRCVNAPASRVGIRFICRDSRDLAPREEVVWTERWMGSASWM